MLTKAIKVVEKIQSAGFEAYFVGGCVRDKLMDIEPKDYDIVTSATPEQVELLFNKTRQVGKNFLVSMVKEQGVWFEVATYRKESYIETGKPKVKYSSIEEDSNRRDFNVNAIYYDPISKEYKDFHNGINDIKNGKFKFIGNQQERLIEDPIRLLRALSFARDLKMEEEIIGRGYLNACPKDRIKDEIIKIIEHYKDGQWLEHLFLVIEDVYPLLQRMNFIEQDPINHPEGNVFNHMQIMIDKLYEEEHDYLDVFAVILHDLGKSMTTEVKENGRITAYKHDIIGKSICRNFCNDFKFSKDDRECLEFIVGNHMRIRFLDEMRDSKKQQLIEHKYYDRLVKLNRLDNYREVLNEG
jgi:poly(A) polymerase